MLNKVNMSCHTDTTVTCSFQWRTSHISGHGSKENRCLYGKSTDKSCPQSRLWYLYFPRKSPKYIELQKGYFKKLWYIVLKQSLITTRSRNKLVRLLTGGTLMYLTNPVESLQEHISVPDKTEDLIFRPVDKHLLTNGTTFQCSPMQTIQFRYMYKCVKQLVFSCKDDNVIWNHSEFST